MELTNKQKIFLMGTAMWKGIQLMNMTRDELYVAFNDMGKYYEGRIKDLGEDAFSDINQLGKRPMIL